MLSQAFLNSMRTDAEARLPDLADLYFPVSAESSVGSSGSDITWPVANYTAVPCKVEQLPRLPYEKVGGDTSKVVSQYLIKFSVDQELPRHTLIVVAGITYFVLDTDEGIGERVTLGAQCQEYGFDGA